MVDRDGLVLALAVADDDRHNLPTARRPALLHVSPDANRGVFAADGAVDTTAFRAAVAALGCTAHIPRNPRKTGRPKRGTSSAGASSLSLNTLALYGMADGGPCRKRRRRWR
jgi:hypothetical protein